MRKRNLFGLVLMVCALCLACTACSTTLVENTETYFSTTSSILSTLFSSSSQTSTETGTSSVTTDSDAIQLDAPTNLTIDEEGNYSFTGVEDADYYLLYFCDLDATEDSDTFIYSSEPIQEDGSGTYS